MSDPPSKPLRSVARQLTSSEADRLRALGLAEGRVIERDGLSVLGLEEAFRIRLPNGLGDEAALRDATASLAGIIPILEAAGGPAPLAIGTIKFLPEAPVELVVPRVLVVARGGSPPIAVVVGIEPSASEVDRMLSEAAALVSTPPPDSFRLESQRSHVDYLERIAGAVEEVRSGRLSKVVMAREVVVEANRPLRQDDLLERLRSLHPSCTAFAVEGFVGASPELLVKKASVHIESHPLAGTAARSGDPEADRLSEQHLMSSVKERTEHRAVVESIAGGLRPATRSLEVPDTPGIVELRNVSHLGTHIRGVLAERPDGTLPSALELLSLIHPTPAISGTPIDLAMDYLAKAEELDRDRYGGAVGWMDGTGDGEWYLGIRCAIVDGRTARLFAGGGIVADSDPAAELAETQLKLQAFLAAAVRP